LDAGCIGRDLTAEVTLTLSITLPITRVVMVIDAAVGKTAALPSSKGVKYYPQRYTLKNEPSSMKNDLPSKNVSFSFHLFHKRI